MKTLALVCERAAGDTLVCDVVGTGVFLDISCREHTADVALSPEKARELAEWLSEAALAAEANEE